MKNEVIYAYNKAILICNDISTYVCQKLLKTNFSKKIKEWSTDNTAIRDYILFVVVFLIQFCLDIFYNRILTNIIDF